MVAGDKITFAPRATALRARSGSCQCCASDVLRRAALAVSSQPIIRLPCERTISLHAPDEGAVVGGSGCPIALSAVIDALPV